MSEVTEQHWWNEEKEFDDDDLFVVGVVLEGLKRMKRWKKFHRSFLGHPKPYDLSVPYRPDISTYKLQVKISSSTCIHALPHDL
jgi:hypothetical protein